MNVLNRVSERVMLELAKILEVEVDLLRDMIPEGRVLEWYNADEDRLDAMRLANHVAKELGETVEPYDDGHYVG